jgi:hypothetical protein
MRKFRSVGDPTSVDGSSEKWKVGGPGKEADALFIVAGDSRDAVSAKADDLCMLAGVIAIG